MQKDLPEKNLKESQAGRSVAWLAFTVLAGVGDVVVMQMYAASQFGPTPVFLPLVLAGVCLCSALASCFLAVDGALEKEARWVQYLVAAIIWIGLVGINLWFFMGVLYVA